MKTTSSLLREFLTAQQTKETLRPRWKEVSVGDADYNEVRTAFRTADDTTEDLLPQLVEALKQAQVDDETDGLLDSLSDAERTLLRRVFSERGLLELLESSTNDLAGCIKKYHKTSAMFTAARELNARRRQVPYDEFVDALDHSPAGVDAEAWRQIVEMLSAEEQKVDEENAGNADVELDDITREAAYRIETRLRERNDAAHERLVALLAGPVADGTLDRVLMDLDPELRAFGYAFQSHVPMPQVQVQTKAEPRAVTVK